MEFHQLANGYPMLHGKEYEAFKADIAANGCHNPVYLFEGKILDGRNRFRACSELGIEPVFAEYDGTDPTGFVESQNEHRRHLTAEWRRQQVKAKRAEGKSTRQIAEEMGIHKTQVIRDLDTVCPPEPIEETEAKPQPYPEPAPETVKGRDGKQYRATKPKTKASKHRKKKESENADHEETWGELTSHLNQTEQLLAKADTIPKEIKPWKLIELLERTGQLLLKRSRELRRRHNL